MKAAPPVPGTAAYHDLQSEQVVFDLVLDDRTRKCRNLIELVSELRALCSEHIAVSAKYKAMSLEDRDARLRLGSALVQARRAVPSGLWIQVLGSLGLNRKTVHATMQLARVCCDESGRMRPVDLDGLRLKFLDQLRRVDVLDRRCIGENSLMADDLARLKGSSLSDRAQAVVLRLGAVHVGTATLEDIKRLLGTKPLPGGLRVSERASRVPLVPEECLSGETFGLVPKAAAKRAPHDKPFDPNAMEIDADEEDEEFEDDEDFAADDDEFDTGDDLDEDDGEPDIDGDDLDADEFDTNFRAAPSPTMALIDDAEPDEEALTAIKARVSPMARGAAGEQLSLAGVYEEFERVRAETVALLGREDIPFEVRRDLVGKLAAVLAEAMKGVKS